MSSVSSSTTCQQQQAGPSVKCDAFSKHSRARYHMDNTTSQHPRKSCGAIPVQLAEVVEIATSGARAPINFMEETAFRRRSRQPNNSAYGAPFPSKTATPSCAVVRQVTPTLVACSSSSRAHRHHHRRRSSAPLDGVCLTLLGVSSGLKTPGVDHWAVARALVESSVDLRTRNARGMTPLHLACSAGQVDVARVLLLAGADSHARDHRSRCPLHMAALAGSEELATSLLACGADPNKASDLGTTPLHNAALLGRIEVARALLVAGADADSTDHNSFSPLYLAAQNGHTQVVLDLLAAGADAEIKTSRGFTPLHVAARCGRLTVIKALLHAGVPVDCSSSPAETTPLHLSAGFSRESCVEELLKRGANPSSQNKRGATPVDLVGTLIPLSKAGAAKDCAVGVKVQKKIEQGKRVRMVLVKAQAWQRRRAAVLLCEALRCRAAGLMAECGSVEGVDKVQQASGDVKRCRRSTGGGVVAGRGDGGGWVIERLCRHSEPVLIRKVIGFL